MLNDAARAVPFINPNVPISSRRQCWSPDFRYAGNLNVTKTGRGCQEWNLSFPHIPKYQPVDLGIGHNFCRNPDADKNGPWCYTIDPDVRIIVFNSIFNRQLRSASNTARFLFAMKTASLL